MAAKKNKDSKAWMIPEGEKRESASHHYVAHKTLSMIREGKKIRVKKYHPKLKSMFGLLNPKCRPTTNSENTNTSRKHTYQRCVCLCIG